MAPTVRPRTIGDRRGAAACTRARRASSSRRLSRTSLRLSRAQRLSAESLGMASYAAQSRSTTVRRRCISKSFRSPARVSSSNASSPVDPGAAGVADVHRVIEQRSRERPPR
eukprot:157775-Rhodomonas_salina.1